MKRTYKTTLNEAQVILKQAGIEEYENDAWLLMSHVFGIDRTHFILDSMTNVSDEKYAEYMNVIGQRAHRRPLQYITGHQEFMNCDFLVNENVLIPRQDTEILVSEAINIIGNNHLNILDMCTGSGCIAISVAYECRDCRVTAVDVSREALQVARENVIHNNVSNVECLQSDLFKNVNNRFDVIISNPPYIETEVIETLEPEVKEFEPMLALDGESDGLKFYRLITEYSVEHIECGGYLMFEIGYNQGEAVSSIMKNYGYTDIRVVRDLAGLDRVVIGKEQHNV